METTEVKKHNLVCKLGKKYKICTCGFSKIIPICDDTHKEINAEKNTSYKSLKIIPDKDVSLQISSSNWK